MAVSIITAPAALQPLGAGVRWVLELDSFGAGTITKKIGYALYESGSDDQITPLRAVRPTGDSTPDQFTVDVTADIIAYGRCKTMIPTLGYGSIAAEEEDTSIIQTIYLKYGEIIYDSDGCTFSTDDVTNNSLDVAVIASAQQLHEAIDYLSGDPYLLNNMPPAFRVFPDTVAWLWALNAGDTSITHIATLADGTTDVLVSSVDAGHQVGIIGITNAAINNHFPSTLKKLVTTIAFSTGGVMFTAIYGPCEPSKIYHEFHVLDPLGGYNTLMAERVQSEVLSSADNVRLPINWAAPDLVNTGTQSISKATFPSQTYRARVTNSESRMRQVIALASGTKAMVRIKKDDGTSILASFHVDPGSVRTYQTDGALDIQFKGQLGHPINVI